MVKLTKRVKIVTESGNVAHVRIASDMDVGEMEFIKHMIDTAYAQRECEQVGHEWVRIDDDLSVCGRCGRQRFDDATLEE